MLRQPEPLAGSGLKTITATVTDAEGNTAFASTRVYVTHVVDQNDVVLHGGERYLLDKGGAVLRLALPVGPSVEFRGVSGEEGQGHDYGYSLETAGFRIYNEAYRAFISLVLRYDAGKNAPLLCPGQPAWYGFVIDKPVADPLLLRRLLDAWLDGFVKSVQVEVGSVVAGARCDLTWYTPTR
ncbi:MAG: hypothetical protein OXG27_01040 [Chloroflexi bacterium]|nr:hypothetical protein [Chloroflexota bacterium]